MAYTLKQLHTARGAGLKLAQALQDFAQVDIKTANILNTDVAAEIKAAADQAVTAASAIGGAATLPATQAIVANGATVNIKNSTGTISKPGVATVAANAVTGVALPATMTIVENGGDVVLTNSAGTDIPGAHVRLVENGAQPSIKLAPTVAAVTSGLSTVAATGTGTKVTFTVANGVITAITLSA